MVLDFSKLDKTSSESGKQLLDGFLTVLEQLPGKFVVEDQTDVLRNRSLFCCLIWMNIMLKSLVEIERPTGHTQAKGKEICECIFCKTKI